MDRIIGPVGLIQAVRDPDMLAVSILAQLVATAGVAPDLIVEAGAFRAIHDAGS